MSENSIFNKNWSDASEADASYTRPSVLALVSAIFGVSTFLVYTTPWFFFLGVIAIVLSIAALWTIRLSEGILTGKPLAYFGLCCASFALASIAIFWPIYQNGVRKEADQFFQVWFATVQEGDLFWANQLRQYYWHRSHERPTEEEIEAEKAKQAERKEDDDVFRDKEAEELLALLTELGDRATVAYHKTLSIRSTGESDTANFVYSVTYEGESGGLETIYVNISGRRTAPHGIPNVRAAGWRLDGSPRPYREP